MENLSSMFRGVALGDFSVRSESNLRVGGPKRIVFRDQRPLQGPSVSELGPRQGPYYDRSYPIQGYHATGAELNPGDHILPANELGQKKTNKMYNDLGHGDFAFFTTEAWIGDYGPNTYRVRAIGEVARDHTETHAWKAPRLEVIQKLQFDERGKSTLPDWDPEQPIPQEQKWEN
ncbi:MAG: hypothetical protein EB168_07965 [Euryarchaeota archaeon]|nr:hypothetical protein [Euryarchaeota archaeon]